MANSIFFYKNVEPLSKEIHVDLKLQPTKQYNFALKNHCVPLAGIEFFSASTKYPVIFLKEGESYIPVALTGLEEDKNLFIDATGKWEEDAYIPAFIRRYPFILAETGGEDQLTVCIDVDYEGWDKKKGEALFTKEGENTPFLENALSLLSSYNVDMKRTQEFVKVLAEKNLFESKNVTIQSPDGETFAVQNVYIVDEAKFMGLDGETLHTLNKQGMLGWVFAHLVSLNNFPALFERFRNVREKKSKAN